MSVTEKVVPLPWQETSRSAWPRHQKVSFSNGLNAHAKQEERDMTEFKAKIVDLELSNRVLSVAIGALKAELNLADVFAEFEVSRIFIKVLTEASHALKEEIVVM